MKLVLTMILAALLMFSSVPGAQADEDDPGARYRPSTRGDRQWIIDAAIEQAIAHDVDPTWVLRVLACETRGDLFKPDARGDNGASWGVAQLHAYGLRPLFYQLGWTDPDDPAQATAFIAWAFANDLAHHWSCK